MENEKIILGIESSCDETAASLVKFSQNEKTYNFEILSNVVASQIDLHKKWGGVYPELASRAHLEAIIPVLEEAVEPLERIMNNELGIKGKPHNSLFILRQDSGCPEQSRTGTIHNSVDSIAVTKEPGLIGSLLVGIGAAKILGKYFNKPIIKVNHLEGHIYSAFAEYKVKSEKLKVKTVSLRAKAKQSETLRDCHGHDNGLAMTTKFEIPKSGIFPILALVVSGGHTSLIVMKDHLQYETVGQTIDDAAGEAFDKVARMIGLGYPGGPEIERIAKLGNENAYKLPLSMKHSGDLNFSFSGLKTAVLYLTKEPKTGNAREYNQADLAASFQKTVTEILIGKALKAIEKYNPKTVILSGGVSANGYLRDRFAEEINGSSLRAHSTSLRAGCAKQSYSVDPSTSGLDRNARDDIGISDCHGHRSGLAMTQDKSLRPTILIPPKNLSTDNAVGIAVAGAIKSLEKYF